MKRNTSLIYGRRYAGTPAQPRTTGGLFAFAGSEGSHKQDFKGNEIAAKPLNDAVEQVFTRGGSANTILCGPNIARQITKLGGDTNSYYTPRYCGRLPNLIVCI